MMPDEPIPLSEHRLQITSTVNEIFRAQEDPYTRVIQGHPFELVCTYYGHPPPPGGLRWSIERVNRTDQKITSHWMAMQGLRIKSGRQYWTQVGTAKFDETGKQMGLYQCAALNRDGGVYKLAQVRVELYKVNVKVAELADSGLIEGVEGENGVITCNAFDGYFDFILPEAVYTWEFEKRNGDRVHRNLLATTVRVDGNRIEYEGLSTAANGFRARCVAMNNTARYVSADFGFRVRRVSGEPVKRPETEPRGTRWAKGDGSEGVLLIITGMNDATGHASLSEGDDTNLTCIAVDSVTNKPFTQGEFHFGWQLAGIKGEPVSTDQLAVGSVQTQSSPNEDAGYFLVENARSSSNPPQPTARILCLATRQSEAVTYVSSPIDYVVYPKDVTPDYKKERDDRDKRSKVLVEVTGLDSRGMLFATEGSVKILKCTAVDRSKGSSPVTDAEYAWEFSRLDGIPVDTTTMVVPGAGTVQLNGDEATFRGLRQTSTVRGRCVVRMPPTEDEAQESRDVYYSPYFKFDVVDENGMGYRDFASSVTPQIPSEKSDIAVVNVTGLDKLGYLTGSVGQDTMLMCTTFNVSTNEPIDEEQYDVHYGWEFQQMDGLPAISSEIASDIQSNSVNGQLQLTHLKEQSPETPTRGRCVVELLPKDAKKPLVQPAHDGKRIASPYFFINVPPKTVVVPEFVDDAETDTLIDGLTAKQTVGWKLPIYPSGQIGNLGDLAQKVQSQGSKLYLDDVRGDAVDGLRGACWFYDGLAYYYSPYFPIVVPRSTTDGRVRVEVQEIGSDDDRRYTCAAYHTQTGTRLLNVSYQWVFTTKTGEPILPGYYFESMQSHENELTFQSRRVGKQLPEHLRDKGPIEGRCLVLYQPFAGDLNKPSRINVYSSNPFILIQPHSEDPSRMLFRPDPLKKDQRVVALVDGVDRGLVTVPEDGTVTLTCQATDSETLKPLENLSYRWEIQQRDGSSVSTSGMVQEAILVEGTSGNRLTLVGVRLKAAGLRGRCIITNLTTAPAEAGVHELGLLRPGEEVASTFFDFNVLRTSAAEDGDGTLEYAGLADFVIDGDPRQFGVVIGGLDESGRLKAQEGEDVTLEVKLKDMATGELKSVHSDPSIMHIGLETRYDNGQSAPFSALAETVKVHGKDGVINLNNVRPGSRPPTQFRVVVEREELISRPNGERGVIVEKKRVRYASDYVDVVALKEGEEEPPGVPGEPEVTIFPVVDGLNECGYLPVKPGVNVALTCRPNDTRISVEDLIYGWEIRHQFGQDVPVVNLLAKGVKQQGNQLYLTQLQDIGIPLIGRCIIIQTRGKCNHFSSPYFPIGPHGPGCGPSEPSVVPDIPGEPVPEKKYQVRIRIEGLDDDGQVAKEPGANVTLKCTALNATTNTPVPNSAIGWEFVSDTGEQLHAGQLASRYELAVDNELRLTHVYRNPNARGRCMVTLEQRVTLSSPYFTFNIQDEETKPLEPISPSYSDKRVRVEVSGLNDRRQISITRVGDDASLRCQAIVVASSSPLHPIHGVRYGWEWRYVDEDPVSTTNVAVNLEANGERLGLRGIRAPPGTRGRNVKGRCVVHVPASHVDQSLSADQLLVYGSDYFSIDVIKKPTTLDPDIIPLPGKAEDATTNKRLSTDGMRAEYNVLYGWEFTDVTGRSIDSSLFADRLSTDANGELRLRGLSGPRRGDLPFKIRCVAIVGKRPSSPDEPAGPVKSYVSDFFAVAVTRSDGSSTMDIGPDGIPPDITGKLITLHVGGLKPDGTLTAVPGETVELQCIATGDGRIVVTVDGVDPALRAANIKPDSTHNLTCVPKEKPVYPKYRVVVDGLDKHGQLSGRVGDSPTLKCEVFDALSGERVEDVFYYWDIRRTDEEAISSTELVTRTLESYANELRFDGLKPISGSVKGRCIVTDHAMETWDASPYFYVNVASDEVPVVPEDAKDRKPSPVGQREANVTDDRVAVTVTGLDENGNFVGKIGDDAELVCNAQVKDGIQAEIVSRGWSLTDQSGRPVAMENLADQVSISSPEGKLDMKRLRKPSVKYLHGQCVVETVLVGTETGPDGSQLETRETLLFTSDKFGISHTEDGTPSEDIVGKDVQGKKITVNIDGLQADNVLHAETGDRRTLTCFAKDSTTGDVVPSAIYYWEFRDQVGRMIPMDDVAERVARKQNSIEFQHLRPTDKLNSNEQRFGRCVVYDTETEHFYRSPYFHLNVRRPDLENATGPDDRVEVHVKGLTSDGILVANEDETTTLECVAFDKDRNENIQASRAVYQFQFTEAVPDSADVYGGYVARGIEQEPLETGGIKLTLEGLKSGSWHKGRCVVLLTSDDDKDPSIPVRRYSSKYFWSGVIKADERRELPEETKNRPVVIGGFTNDPSVLQLEVIGLNPDGTLSRKEGEDVRLACEVVDRQTGMPIEDEFDFGWSIGTGPDGRPVALNDLAESVKIRKGQLELSGLQRTSPKSGGLRSYCTVRLRENQLLRPEDYPNKTVNLNSDSFVIHVEPPDDVPVKEPEEKDIPPFTNWISGKGSCLVLDRVFLVP
ncbi:uncharacterized protein DEA37_0013600 [Paragonimus westermani]|uniref:Ig-like domain-containing protein n=1 Tax=Paragonimus westermani TaxID=34504 RepID=A0A5J4NEL8_9TREM|nr:uncharacterized protein DEA37_0013600 [Paragonimus westermani]